MFRNGLKIFFRDSTQVYEYRKKQVSLCDAYVSARRNFASLAMLNVSSEDSGQTARQSEGTFSDAAA